MRAVLDTNVFVSGIFWTGTPNKILKLWKEQKFTLVSSVETVAELVRILKDFKIRMPESMIREWVDLIVRNSVIVSPEQKLRVVIDDPKDDIFIEAALTGQADYIVSQDKHLLKLQQYQNVKIITPEQFKELLEVRA